MFFPVSAGRSGPGRAGARFGYHCTMFRPAIQPARGFLTFSTGFSTVSRGKSQVFQGVFPLFPPGFQHQLLPAVIRQVEAKGAGQIFSQEKAGFCLFLKSRGGKPPLIFRSCQGTVRNFSRTEYPARDFSTIQKGSFPGCGKKQVFHKVPAGSVDTPLLSYYNPL